MILNADKVRESTKSWENVFKAFGEHQRRWQEIMDNIDESDIDNEEQIESTSLIDHNVETANLDSSDTASETLQPTESVNRPYSFSPSIDSSTPVWSLATDLTNSSYYMNPYSAIPVLNGLPYLPKSNGFEDIISKVANI